MDFLGRQSAFADVWLNNCFTVFSYSCWLSSIICPHFAGKLGKTVYTYIRTPFVLLHFTLLASYTFPTSSVPPFVSRTFSALLRVHFPRFRSGKFDAGPCLFLEKQFFWHFFSLFCTHGGHKKLGPNCVPLFAPLGVFLGAFRQTVFDKLKVKSKCKSASASDSR